MSTSPLCVSILVLLAASINGLPHVLDKPFEQAHSTLFTYQGEQIANWNQLPFDKSTPVVQVAHRGGGSNDFYVLTLGGLWILNGEGDGIHKVSMMEEKWFQLDSRLVALNSEHGFAIAGRSGLAVCTLSATLIATCNAVTPSNGLFGSVSSVVATAEGNVWIGCETGLYFYGGGQIQRMTSINESVTAVAVDPQSQAVAAGTSTRLWRKLNDRWHYFWVPGIIDAAITGLSFDGKGTLWIANSVCLNLQHSDLTMERIGGLEGLPTANLTSISASGDTIWIGALHGGMCHSKEKWSYYYGSRWMPGQNFNSGQHISSVAASPHSKMALFSTDNGLSLIKWEEWTLEKKANMYQSMVYPRHDRYGLVADVGLKEFGNLNTYEKRPSDNDGLWTSIYVASQCFRYAATKDPQAKADAWRSFEALEFLNNVTGIKGLMARSIFLANSSAGSGTWHNSTVYPAWQWKGDTSSDEVTGHMMVYPLVYHLVAETPMEKARVKNLLYSIVHYIVENGFLLIDVTGKPTTWGRWSPEYLNDDTDWYDNRGVNSIQILSWLLSAHHLTKDQYFLNAYNELVFQYGYNINIINQKITEPSDDNFSDDELAWLPYLTYIFAAPPELQTEFKLSIDRAWRISKSEKSSLWNLIFGLTGATEFGLEDAVWCLQTWPLSMVDWPVQNSHRLDIKINPDLTRSGTTQSETILPYDEISVYRWNANPFVLDSGDGHSECDPSAYLLPYWLGRYYGFIQ